MCLWSFFSFFPVVQKSVNVGYVNQPSSAKSQISRGTKKMASALGLAPPSIKGDRNRKDHHSLICNFYSLNPSPGSSYKWIPRYLRIILLPMVFTSKKAPAEMELKIGARGRKDEQLEIIF